MLANRALNGAGSNIAVLAPFTQIFQLIAQDEHAIRGQVRQAFNWQVEMTGFDHAMQKSLKLRVRIPIDARQALEEPLRMLTIIRLVPIQEAILSLFFHQGRQHRGIIDQKRLGRAWQHGQAPFDIFQELLRQRVEQCPLILEMLPEIAFRDAAFTRQVCRGDIAEPVGVEQRARCLQNAITGLHQALACTMTGTSV